MGAFSYFAAGEQLPEPVQDRAVGFGITLLVVGSMASIGSLLARHADRLWYRKPSRWRMLRGDRLEEVVAAVKIRGENAKTS